jgi:general secretion pathway protein B
MSFILDALKKSETERQEQAGGEFSRVPSGSGESQSFKWLWILAFLLLVNALILAGILMGPDRTVDAPRATRQGPAEPIPAAEPTFEEKVAEAKQNQPPPIEVAPVPPRPREQQAGSAQRQPSASDRVMTIDEVRLDGSLQVTDLHLDIHVYSDKPAERFVFINMVKHREQSRLKEGPVVSEITPDGVILEHQGTTFLLPRE